jgi:replicative DNA helicase
MATDINTEFVITRFLLKNREYLKKVFPYLNPLFFQLPEYQRITKAIKVFYTKYEKAPPYSSLVIYFKEKVKKISEDELKVVLETLHSIENFADAENYSIDYALEISEEYFRKRSLFNALVEAESIFETKPNDVNSIPDIIQNSLRLCFDNSIGHDYFEDSEEALEHYHSTQLKFPTHLEKLNEATGGGLAKGKLHVFLGQPGGGKSRLLVDLESHYVKQGMNCLFVSLELDTLDIRQRFDANIMDININDFPRIDREKFHAKINQLKIKTYGKLIIHHYPGGSINRNNLENLLDELKNKKNFIPEVIAIDYIALVNPVVNMGGKLYETGKQVSMELKSFFDKHRVIGLAPNQLNKGGWDTSDVMMSNVADSAGIMHNADFCAAISGSRDLLEQNKFALIILKNRLYKLGKNRKMLIGFDDDFMRHFDVSQGDLESDTTVEQKQAFDKEKFKNWKF